MGKAQSKRSVDITTETTPKDGKVVVEEGSGKMGKIEDVDELKPQINGDTNHTDELTVSRKFYYYYLNLLTLKGFSLFV